VKARFRSLLLFYALVIGTAVVIYPQQLDLARIYFRSYQIDMAFVELNKILQKGGDVFYAVKEYANITEEVGDLNKAIAFHQELLKTSPDNKDILQNLAKLYAWTEHPEKATDIYEDMHVKNPKDRDILKKLVDDLIWYGRLEKAAKYLEAYVKLNPSDHEHRRRLAQLYSSLKRVDDMIRLYEGLERSQPDVPEWKEELAEAYFWKKDAGRAIGKYEDILKADPGRMEIYEKLAKIHIWNRDLPKGYEIAARMEKRFGADTAATRLISELYAQTGHFAEAAGLTESLYERGGLRDDLENAIHYHSWSGAVQKALGLYARLMDSHALRPEEFDDYLALRLKGGRGILKPARLLNDTGLRDRLHEDLFATFIAAAEIGAPIDGGLTPERQALLDWRRRAETIDPLIAYFFKNAGAHTSVAGLRSTLGDFYLFTHPSTPDLARLLDSQRHSELADIYQRLGAYSHAVRVASPGDAGRIARLEAERDRIHDQAIRKVEGEMARAPDSEKMQWVRRLLNQYRASRHAGQIAAAYEIKYRLQALDPHEAILLAEWFSAQNQNGRAAEILERHAGGWADPYPLKLLVRLYEETRAPPNKILTIRERIAAADPADVENHVRLVVGYLETGDAPKYEKALARIETRFGKNAGTLNVLAQQFLWAEKIDLAVRFYDRILEKNPEDYDVQKMKATVLYWNQRYKEADAAFRKCMALKPDDLEVLFRDAEIYTYWRKPADARRLYEAIYRQYPKLPDEKKKTREVRVLYASVLIRLVRLPEAVDLYRKLYRETPDNREIRLNFAEALMQTRQFSEAEIVLKSRTP